MKFKLGLRHYRLVSRSYQLVLVNSLMAQIS